MISISVRLFLQSLCSNSPWDYAVFWRLQQYQSEMVLTWEDGLFDIKGSREFRKGITDQFYSDCFYERFSSAYRFSNQTASLADSPVGDLLAEMSSIYYLMGKGVVGEVAYTESPVWVYDDIIMATGSNSSSNSKCPGELFHQFVAGIKTVLLLPLLPHGVIQLGSLDMVAEDAELIIYVRNLFAAHCQLAGHFSPYRSDRQVPVQQPELISSYMENLGELPGVATTEMNEDLRFLGDANVEDLKTAACTSFPLENLNCISQTDEPIVFGNESEGKIHMQLSLSDVAGATAYRPCETSESGPKQDFKRSYQDDYLEAVSLFTDYEMTNYTAIKLLDSYSSESTIEPSCGSKDYDITTCNEIQLLRFPTDCELHKALGSVLLDKTDLNLLHSAVPEMDASRSSGSNDDTTNGIQPSAWVSGEQFTKENNMEHLLEAVVTNTSSISDDSSSIRSHFAMPLKASSGEDGITWSCLTTASGKERESKMKNTPSEHHIIMGNQPQKDVSTPVAKGSKQIGATKRRVRDNNNQKPRPRDRQLIQDRIKELRQLIPNATKCSIDGLLDKTVKHMQFLRNVTDHADKMRQHVRKEASDNKHPKPHIAKDINKLGTSWALELGSEQKNCPIIVKDLGHPGHMLIEMLCNDNGCFMEIADVVHRLGLTILKGVMERCPDDSTWAHFVVEASKSFHRLDIFWPLMQLLQHNQTQTSSKI